jgi:ubiquinol-cytochrome c reductase cytochrome b subunit
VFIPALVPLGLIFTGAALWPFLEQWVTGDKREHHLLDRPRNAPTRTAIGIAVITFYGVLWAEGANDVIAEHFDVSLYLTTQIAQVAWLVAPVLAYIITKRICLGLQRKDVHLLEHGVETGIIRQLPHGEYIEETAPVDEEARAVLESRPDYEPLPPAGGSDDVPAPGMRGALGKVRARLYNVVTESVPLPDGHADGHGDGHPAVEGNGHGTAPAAVTSGQDEESSADGSDH